MRLSEQGCRKVACHLVHPHTATQVLLGYKVSSIGNKIQLIQLIRDLYYKLYQTKLVNATKKIVEKLKSESRKSGKFGRGGRGL